MRPIAPLAGRAARSPRAASFALAACLALFAPACSRQPAPSMGAEPELAEGEVRVELLRRLGVEVSEGPAGPLFRWQGREFGLKEDVLAATLADPRDERRLVAVLHGNHPEAVAWREQDHVAARKPFLSIWRQDGIALQAPLSPDGRVDPERIVRASLERYYGTGKLEPLGAYAGLENARAGGEFRPGELEQSAFRMAAARRRAMEWCGIAEMPPVLVDLTTRCEDLLRAGERQGPGFVSPASNHAMCLVSGVLDDGGAAVASVALRQVLGAPRVEWIGEAAAIDAADLWHGEPLERWAARLLRLEPRPAFAPLVDEHASRKRSRHLVAPLRALLLRFLREKRGDFELVRHWRGESRLDPSDAALESEWRRWIAARAGAQAHLLPYLEAPLRIEPALLRFGAALAHSPRDAGRMPGSQAWLARLDELRGAGISTVSIPLTLALRPATGPEGGRRADLDLGCVEGDLSAWAASLAARARGMGVHFDLTLVATDSGPLIGATAARDPESWAEVYDGIAVLVEHAALLAQLSGANSLSIANATPQITMQAPSSPSAPADEPRWKTEGWRRVVARARAAYGGLLTYTAGDPREVASIGFWQDLDRVSYALFPDLDTRPEGRDQTARAFIESDAIWQVEQALAAARAAGKPLWLTRVGFERAAPGWQARQWSDFERLARRLDADPAYAGFVAWRVPVDPGAGERTVREVAVEDEEAERAAIRAVCGR
ncbi:MAG: hypothetical protein RL112_2170 [Planctomycetota bacterium]